MKQLSTYIFIFVLCFITYKGYTQEIRTEIFAGNEEPVFDVFWIKPVAQKSPFLFLSRNTFKMPEYEDSLQNFSTLGILAYQYKKTGFGLALAGTATSNAPFQGRAGIQYMKVKPEKWVLYSIISTKLGEEADARWLTIFQYTPELSEKLDLFTRVEWVSSIGYEDDHRFSANILRLGLQTGKWQFGLGTEFLWLGKDFKNQQENYGIFLTYLF